MTSQTLIRFLLLPAFFAATLSVEAQFRRPGLATVKKEDRTKSSLNKEDGAIYLEGMVNQEVKVRVTKSAPTYSNLTAERWLGNVFPNQNAVLLAVSDKAYRVRAKAKQGQVAGWVSKAAIEGLAPGFEAKLRKYYDRYMIVQELIENNQVALGMTIEEVAASIGPPNTRSSTVEQSGRTDILEYISFERVPRTVTTYNSFGVPVPTTQYVEVENGRVTIEFSNNMVSLIKESEGVDLSKNGGMVNVPPLVYLF